MECLRSFTQSIIISNTLTSLNAVKSFWTIGLNNHCSAIATFAAGAGPAVFKPEGFKNIDVYGISITGEIISDPANTTQGGIIDTWGVLLNTVGNYSEISGTFSNQALTVSESPVTISLSRYANYIEFRSPIKSIKNISFNNIYVQASACQTTTNLALSGQLQLNVFYKFEGE
jgi:hypothetical protein